MQALFADRGVPVEFAGVSGQPAEEIVEVADEHRVDLIVVGTREPGFLERLLGGSVSQGVARRAHCDVLIVHSPEQGAD
ncbi:MAG: universal stress protein [Gaiellaceae bacterium]